ncbi:FAD-binding oxidoreductase [Microbacterium sp. X-17]|uniref:FAD-binding oxidoreductase n=1 Tax=Microbacterium sp. X-17 TaxID=3144404 RepID=UPI0031F5B581
MSSFSPDDAAERLRASLGPLVIFPGDPEYDVARSPWNTAVDQRPFAVARPASADEVAAVVRAAVAAGLRVAPQSAGHAAAALADTDLADVVLVSLARLRGVTVDAEAGVVRVAGGTLWGEVIAETAPHGLTALHGSAGDVSVAGYALSGGVSFYGRRHGLAANAIRAVTLVTADGRQVTVDAGSEPELFWAVRGGAGAFGIAVSLDVALLPYADVFAGMLLWDASHAGEVARAWAAWTATAPESATTSLRIMHFPPIPELPPFLRGRSVVAIDGAILEADDEASDLLAPLRALAPELDTFGRIPVAEMLGLHMDPPQPTPGYSATAMLSSLPAEAADAFVEAAMSARPMVSELRHVGGAIARPLVGGGAVSSIEGDYLLGSVSVVPTPEALAPARTATAAVIGALGAWRAPSLALTFLDGGGVDPRPGFGASADRLAELKRSYDPADVFVAAHPVT